LANYTAFTYRVPGDHRHAIVIDIQIGVPVPVHGYPKDARIFSKAQALIDTGATRSSISRNFAGAAQLASFRRALVRTAQGEFFSPVYRVDVVFPNSLTIKNVDVTEYSTKLDFDFIIGMDILRTGDMCISNADNVTVFSFRSPPYCEHTDYTKTEDQTP
jgi:predicted aspartyl protease